MDLWKDKKDSNDYGARSKKTVRGGGEGKRDEVKCEEVVLRELTPPQSFIVPTPAHDR